MNGRAVVTAVVVFGVGVLTPSAAASVQFRFTFSHASPGTPTAGHVKVLFPTDDQGRPKQLAGLAFKFPRGTAIDRSVAPVCTATNDQIDMLGARLAATLRRGA